MSSLLALLCLIHDSDYNSAPSFRFGIQQVVSEPRSRVRFSQGAIFEGGIVGAEMLSPCVMAEGRSRMPKALKICSRILKSDNCSLGYPRDAPATVLFGEWFCFGKPSDQYPHNVALTTYFGLMKLDHNAHDHEVLWLSRFGGCFWHFWTNLPFSGWLPLALSMMQVVPFSQRLQQLKLHQLPVLPVSNNISWLPFVLAFGLHLEQPKRPIVDLNLTAYSVFSMVAAVLVIKPKSGNKEMDDQGCKCDTGEERMMIHKITKLKLAI
ncbi:hypothetical protein LXL04_029091 [Taraxacum kok-saghyz]